MNKEGVAINRSEMLFNRAKESIPGGVNSPARAFKAVGRNPLFIQSAAGCRLIDVDGREYIDYIGSWGPMILGHGHPVVVKALHKAVDRGTSFGAPTELEVLIAEKIRTFFPSMDKVRLVNSGTEATMSALRVARAFTGRSIILKFDGCYHGHADGLLVKAGSGVVSLGLADSPGVPAEFARCTVSLPYGDLELLERAFEDHTDKVAAVILEPVTGNMGVIPPNKRYLESVIDLAERFGALAIFDEVMSGFRVSAGGAQGLFSLQPHLTCLGKIVGGGLPIGAYGGRRDIMSLVAPEGPVYQAGTLSGNPLAVTAGLETLELLERDDPYPDLEKRTARLCQGLRDAAEDASIKVQVQRCGSMFTLFFNSEPVRDYRTALRSDTDRFARYFHGMLERGIYWAPSQFEACFVSTAHGDGEIDQTIDCAGSAFKELDQT